MIDNNETVPARSVDEILEEVVLDGRYFSTINSYDPKNENDMHDLKHDAPLGVLLGVDEDGIIFIGINKK